MHAVPVHSLKAQLAAALALLFVLLANTIGYTSYELNQRRHDYKILNLAGQLRIASRSMIDQSVRYLEDSPDDYEKYGRDLKLYYPVLEKQIQQFEQVVRGFEVCQSATAASVGDAVIECHWDEAAHTQLVATTTEWRTFRAGVERTLGKDSDGPRLTAAAEFIAQNGAAVDRSVEQLALSLQSGMERKLERVRYFLWAAGLVVSVIFLLLLRGLFVRVLRPLTAAQRGFAQVAQGDFGHQVPVATKNELGVLVASFNQLAQRVDALFRFAARINRGATLDETLQCVRAEFQRFVAVDWIGVLTPSAAEPGCWQLERYAADAALGQFDASTGLRIEHCPAGMLETCRPVACNPALLPGLPTALTAIGLRSFVLVPLPPRKEGEVMLAFAARETDIYDAKKLEFLGNISSQVGPVLDRTMILEGLVVAAVGGLAKLAESRDPETGDHLLRMARYSALIAEELGREERFHRLITPAYVRDILRFAPMHDIGKVGIADSILLKPGKLDAAEFSAMQRHPLIGGEVLRRCETQVNELGHSIFSVAVEIAEGHHEKFDGSGYPRGLTGEEIPLSARIIAVADVFDALTSRRPYKEAWTVEQARDALRRDTGRHFDPEIVAAFERTMPKAMLVYERYKHV
ncbi:MAG: HD domain-containing phosphohydrolase [Rugosibacter sp.]|nr:HD domain-containing phosphohydrolase [Rugosibacter sp.]